VTALDRFMTAAEDLGIRPQVRRFPQGTKTAADAAAAIGCDLGQIVKSLVFSVDGRPILALTSGVNRADVGRLAALAGGEDVRRATPEEARVATGFAVGGTPPFGHPAPVPVFVDRDLLQYDEVWAAAGTPDSVFPLTPGDLVRLTNGQVVDLKEPS
jgi:prolyl-tRNA editing enzyme YbaK/EbsC (Cys-tRNA(Pro) deacylase)